MEPADLSEWRVERACERFWLLGQRAVSELFAKLAAVNPLPSAAWSRILLISWKPLRNGALRDVPVLADKNGIWSSLSTKPQIEDGRHRVVATDGKAVYAPVLERRTRELAGTCSVAVVALVRHEHPDDLEGASG